MLTSDDEDQARVECDVVDLLHLRHEQISNAFADVVSAEGAVKATLFDELVTVLAVREAVAHELIRPFLERHGPVRSAVSTEQATEVVSRLSRLSSLDVEDDHFNIELVGVARVVTLDIEAQERDDLPLLRRSLPAEERYALGELLVSAETIARASASAIQTDIASSDALGPRRVFAALGDMIRAANRP